MAAAVKAGHRRQAKSRPPVRKETRREADTPKAADIWYLTDWQYESENWYGRSCCEEQASSCVAKFPVNAAVAIYPGETITS